MRSLETLARAYSLAKVMLTVFEGAYASATVVDVLIIVCACTAANMGARKFYKHLNYESDEICPSKYAFGDADEKPDYLIMSRSIRARSGRSKKKKKQKAS